ncbi:TonB-dependent receptor [Alteromonadaceae bacterium Bs31]|nr:TonB-dependent receptor [Alteromonadaceae bacterium Bs31]
MGASNIRFKKKLIVTAISSALLVSAGQLAAQDQMEEEVIVRGIKSSLERSLDIKRESTQLVEAITADDIGKMPDQNVTESLQRLPGIQIDRRDGEGTRVRIRGLDQNVTLLNGETFTSGLEYFQLGEWKQEFDSSLEGIPSELLGGVSVYKSPVASMVEGGMGGTIDLKTRNAFDLNELLVAGNIKVDQGLDSSSAKPNAFFVVGNNFDDKFGVIASVSGSQKVVHTDYIQNFSRENSAIRCTEGGTWDADTTSCSAGQSYIAPGMFYAMDTQQERERLGASLNMQWRVSDSFELGYDLFYSTIDIENAQYTVKHPMNTDGAAGVDETKPYSINSSNMIGVLERGSVVTPGTETNTAGEVTSTEAFNHALKAHFDNGGKFRFDLQLNASNSDLEGRAGYADSRFSEYAMRAYVGASESATGWNGTVVNPSPGGDSDRYWDYKSGDQPSLTYGNANWLSNPDYHTYKSHWALGSNVESDTTAFRADFEYDLEYIDLKTIKFGGRYAQEETDFEELRFLTDFSRTTGVMTPNLYNSDGSLAQATTFDTSTAPDSTYAGVAESVYYDLCGNGGIPDGQTCDIDGDGEDDNQPYGPWGYFLDAAIGVKGYELTTSTGANLGDLLYGTTGGGRWSNSPGYLAWQTYTAQPDNGTISQEGAGSSGDSSRYIVKDDFFRSGGYSASTVAFQDAGLIVKDPAAWINSIAPNSPTQAFEVPLESWKVKQSTTAFYAEADFEGESVPYTLNVGARLVGTEVDVTAAVTTPESSIWSIATDGWNSQGVLLTWDTETTSKTYWDMLPSMNFVLDTSDNMKIRFSAAKVIARPGLQALGKGYQKNFTRVDDDPNPGDTYYMFTGGTTGNPDLDPYRATQADAGIEWYFGEMGYVSGTVFVKAVESFLAGATRTVEGEDDSPSGSSFGGVTSIENGDGGSVNGLELATMYSWDNGLGFTANYTYSTSKASAGSTTNPNIGLPGISENSINLIGFYENEVISARIAYTWRDEFVSPDRPTFDVGGLESGATEFFDAYGQWDANITWDVLDKLSLTAEAINIAGSNQSSYLAYPSQPMTYSSQEPRVVLGLSFRL